VDRIRWAGAVAIATLVASFLLVGPTIAWVTDRWWFESVGQAGVFDRLFLLRLAPPVAAGLAVAAGVGVAGELAGRPDRRTIGRTPRWRVALPALVAGAVAALVTAVRWADVALAVYGESFGWTDPVHGYDASFYVFVLPVVDLARSLGWIAWFGAAVASVIGWLGAGAVQLDVANTGGRLELRGWRFAPGARRHAAALVATGGALVAAGAWLGRYSVLSDPSGIFGGPGETDVAVGLPLAAVVAVGAAAGGLVGAWAVASGRPARLLPAALLVGAPVALRAVVPPLHEQYRVLPNELALESPHIQHHIDATRFAFDVADVEEHDLTGSGSLDREALARHEVTLANVRLWDHRPLLDTFSQVQEIRTYYDFSAVDNDRYMVDGALRQVMLSPRELVPESLPELARTWVNEAMTYTHGYGVALGPVNEVTPEGLPTLWVKDLPPVVTYPDALRLDRPEIYFGEAISKPVFVGTGAREFDYPTGDDAAYTSYEGRGGVPLGGALARAVWSLRLGASQVMFSADLRPDSRVLLVRNVRDIVGELAPFVRWDRDPYPVIVDGRIVWMLDGYTTAPRFPYATRVGPYSYMRASVKATVDAYDGDVHLYAFDDVDPVLAAWRAAVPGLFEPRSAFPEALVAHLQVPSAWFDLQSRVFATYHMTDPQMFYNREDEWQVPVVGAEEMQPYYTVMRLPGEERPEFLVMLPFVPKTKENLTAWMVARTDGDAYGTLRVYRFPKDRVVYGPGQIFTRFNQDTSVSEKLSLWNQRGSSTSLGTMLVIPLDDALLYVQPLYLQAETSRIPELKRVLVAYESRVVMAGSLDEALDSLFPAAEPVADAPIAPAPGTEAGLPVVMTGDVAARALAELEAARAAAAAGDWTGYGAALDRLEDTLRGAAATP
jgi:uncharacterized membrane protein (UPF0182 family)